MEEAERQLTELANDIGKIEVAFPSGAGKAGQTAELMAGKDYIVIDGQETVAVEERPHRELAQVSEKPAVVVPEGPGRFNHREAYCLITYKAQKGDKVLRIWNSRDGKVPDQYIDMERQVFDRCHGTEVCMIDHIPALYAVVIDDKDNSGTPCFRVAREDWLRRFKKLHSNPEGAIKRLEGQLEAQRKQMIAGEKATDKKLQERDQEIDRLKRMVHDRDLQLASLNVTIENQLGQINSQARQIIMKRSEILRLERFEQLCNEFIDKVKTEAIEVSAETFAG